MYFLKGLPAVHAKDTALADLQWAARPRSTFGRAAPSRRPSGTAVDVAGLEVFVGGPLPAADRAALRRLL